MDVRCNGCFLDTLDALGVDVTAVSQSSLPKYLSKYADEAAYKNAGALKEPDFEAISTRDRQPSTPKKFAYGLLFGGLSFIVMIIPAYVNGTESLVSPWWLVLSFFLVVLGELLLSPVGLSTTTKLAPTAFAAQTMSLWFMTRGDNVLRRNGSHSKLKIKVNF